MRKPASVLLLAGAMALAGAGASAQGLKFGYGRTPSAGEIAGWDIDVRGQDGAGLPPGHGSVKEGEKIFGRLCVACHGDFGEGIGNFPALTGGKGSLASDNPLRTVGSYWPYAPTVFDFMRRAMPFNAPNSLTADQAYALTAYVLFLNDLLPADGALDAKSLAGVKMPNRKGFISPDPRPDTHDKACMQHCLTGAPRITSEAAPDAGAQAPTPRKE
ncbi:MAG TPA: cytochrome c [Candidatus Cybelea sp.]|nr:cytochrome c [Candidatus Cybelea sp.]